MNRHASLLAATALLLSAAVYPAGAIDLNAGGAGVSTLNGGGGSSVSYGDGGNAAGVTLGGDSIAGLGGDADGTGGSLTITGNDGDLVGLDGTDGTANLGLSGLFDGLGPGGEPVTETQVASAFGGLSGVDQALVKDRCRTILANATAFDDGLVALCRMIRQLR